jgi:protein-S-isoprenylcysteine O-methyltransferase Ste14
MRQWFLPPQMVVVAALSMVALDQHLPIADLRGIPVHWSGLALVFAGLTISLKHARMFSKVGTEINTFRKPQKLVHNGLFKYSRNPMYLGFMLALAGLAIFLGCASAFIPVLVFFVLAQFWYIPFEEESMNATFGTSYHDYKGKVRRWL